MRRKNLMVRLFRALSGETQKSFGRKTGVHHVLLAQYEQDSVDPSPGHLDRLGEGVGLTVAAGEQLLDLADVLREPRRRGRQGVESLADELSDAISGFYQRLLRQPLPDGPPRPEDRQNVANQWQLLADLPESEQLAVVRVAREFQTWALVERVCEESVVQASRKIERATSLAQLAQEIAERVQGPEGWRNRVQGYAVGHVANAQRVAGDLKGAQVTLIKAKRLWATGSDPAGVLDSGRLLNLEGALCRDQRRFTEALALLDQAAALSPTPELALIQKGFTLEVMGDYERAVETLLEALPLVESRGDDRLCDILHLNLALNLCHQGRYGEAGEIGQEVRARSGERGDEILVLRGVWLEGRIAAGLGRTEEALGLLAQARREFAARGMGYDVALALLEEAALLLEEGRTAEVRALTPSLAKVFDSKGVHREALAALQLFKEAAERREATAELARRVLGYLFRARYDQGLRFTAS